jgi:hypothetical protein
MERVDLHVMFYYYSACLHLGKTKENFSIVGVLYVLGFINTGYFTSDNVPDGIKNATHNTFSNFRKKLATEIKISKQQKIATEQIKTATRLKLITFKIEKRKTKL